VRLRRLDAVVDVVPERKDEDDIGGDMGMDNLRAALPMPRLSLGKIWVSWEGGSGSSEARDAKAKKEKRRDLEVMVSGRL
jgi:hypothetical protein